MRRHITSIARPLAAAAGLVAVVAIAGCSLFNKDTSPSTAVNTETFSGSLAPGGSVVFSFTVAQTGTVNVTLTALTPASSAAVGLGVGTPSGSTACTVTASTSSAVAGSAAQLTTTESAGSYCVKVFDVGTLTAATTATVTVAHP